MGYTMGITKVDKRGRITIPQDIREELDLRQGKEIKVEKNDKGILLKPLITKEEFIKALEGCITESNQVIEVEPSKLKDIWGVTHAHD